ncbi:hypothetical protein AB0C76_34015 [Kitasatospora sp. NPDC048722]|uniref:three-helix bundle dimerization domain-containing protein n=1 Tax=Kitasatospora sp. NPDC048722 TaxID=3155639 RepID=UPI0033C2344F
MGQDPEAQEEAALRAVRQRLHQRFDSCLGANTVDRVVERVQRGFDASPIRSFIPILVERQATDALRSAQRSVATNNTEN